jgi:hypothetical protein
MSTGRPSTGNPMVIPTHRIQAMSGAFFAIIVFHQLS